ncbi:MAG: hypothetical protein JWM18_2538, partial [Chloroflexi bacterium]|nr:hypothetical protein [Chloroflexota bacterium]
MATASASGRQGKVVVDAPAAVTGGLAGRCGGGAVGGAGCVAGSGVVTTGAGVAGGGA